MKTINNIQWSAYVLAIFFIIIGNLGFSQTSNDDLIVTLTPEEGLVPCGVMDTEESVHVVTTTALNNIEFSFFLPPGIFYVPGSVVGVSELDISNLNQPIFDLGNMPAFGVIDFTITRTAGCEAVQYANQGNALKDAYSVSYDGGLESPLIDNDQTLSTYLINSSTLVLSAITTEYVNVGAQVIERDITINQGGTGCTESLTHFVVLEPTTVASYQLEYNATILVPNANSTTDTLYYDIDLTQAPFHTVGNGDGCFDNGESITLQENFTVTGCNQTPTKHHAFWGCSFNDHCQDATPQTGSILFSTEVPEITLNYTEGSSVGLNLCSTKTFEMMVTNNNPNEGAAAIDLLINLGLGHNSSSLTQHDYNPFWHYANMPGDNGSWDTRFISNFTINGIATTDTASWGSTAYGEEDKTVVMIKDLLTSDPDGAGIGLEDLDNDGFYDDLGPGQSFIFSYDIHIENMPDHCHDGGYSQYLGWEHCYTDISFLDQCNTQRPGVRKDVSYQNLISQYNVTNELTAPTDIYDGEEFEVSIIPKLYTLLECDGTDNTTQLSITLPDGVFWTGEQPDFNTENELTDVNDTMYYEGNSLIYQVDIKNDYDDIFTIPLIIDCNIYSGNTLILPIVANYTCGGGCFSVDYFCGTFPTITTHCPNSCAGPTPFGMDAHRITAGWTDHTMTTLVDLDSLPEHELDSYLARDTMQVDTYTLISDTTLSNLWIDVYYNTTLADNEVLEYLSSSFTTLDLSTGTTSTGEITGIPEFITDSTGNYIYRFDISQSIPASQLYEDGDSIWFTANFVIKDDYAAGAQINFSEFRFRPFSILQGGEIRSCNSWGDQVKVLKSATFLSNWFGTATQLDLCTPTNMNGGTMRVWDNVTDQHPSEYRPPILFDSYTVYIPENIIFTGTVSYQGFQGAMDDPTGDLLVDYDENNNTVTFYPNPAGNYYDHDQGGLQPRQLRVGVIASCELNDQELIPFTVDVSFRTYGYTNATEELIYTDYTMANYAFDFTSPTFQLQSPNIVNNGITDIATWDIDVANTSTGTIPYNWLRIEEPTWLEVTRVQNAFTLEDINYVSEGGYVYAEIGSIEPGGDNPVSIRISASFSSCESETISVFHGWDCMNYPSDYATENESTCYANAVELSLEPLTSEVQFALLNTIPLPVTMCAPFDIEMEINSSDAADLVNPYISFIIPGGSAGMSIVDDSVSVEYPFDSGDIQNVSVSYNGSMVIINLLEHSTIGENHGISGVSSDNTVAGRKAKIVMTTQTHCEFIANSILQFRAFGESPCGTPAVGNGITSSTAQISIEDAVVDYEFINTITSSSDEAIGCDDQDVIAFESFLFSGVNGETGDDDQGKITLPVGVAYAGDFNCSSAECPTFLSTTFNDQGEQEIIFDIPAGLGNGDLMEYSISIEAMNQGCSDSAIRLATYTNVYGVVCESENCPIVIVQTGYDDEEYLVTKPQPSIEAADDPSTITIYSTTNNYFVNFDLSNDFTEPLTAGYAFDIYCADETGEPIGESLYTGSTPSSILPDSTSTISVSFQTEEFCNSENGLHVSFVPSATNCQCEAISASIELIEIEDTDYDGISNPDDEDIDNDGITNIVEDLNLDDDFDYTTDPTDTDGDGIPNYKDLDSDNDGIADIVEAGGLDPDGDGRVPVNEDGTLTFDFENDGLTDEFIVDTDQDGEADQAVDLLLAGAAPIPNHDTDNDGIPNALDIDSDGDGITDIVENGGADQNQDGRIDYQLNDDPTTLADMDEDGFADSVDTDNNTTPGAGDGALLTMHINGDDDQLPNYLDIDSDGDGIVDNIEFQSTFQYQSATGLDEDGDGLDNAYDKDQGNAKAPVDTDGDQIFDYLDLDSDNDEMSDYEEGWDWDNDGIADTESFGVDTDRDGLDNAYDTEDNANNDLSYMINASNEMTPFDFPDVDNPAGDLDWREVYIEIQEFNVLDGFSPNGDNINEELMITGLEKFSAHEVTIFNRWGNVIWQTKDYINNPWDGTSMFGLTVGGSILPAGTYFYQIVLEGNTLSIDESELQGYIYLNK